MSAPQNVRDHIDDRRLAADEICSAMRHACGYKLANDGVHTRALQHYLGHRNIQHTVRYNELAPTRFRDFWKDGAGKGSPSDWRPFIARLEPTVRKSH